MNNDIRITHDAMRNHLSIAAKLCSTETGLIDELDKIFARKPGASGTEFDVDQAYFLLLRFSVPLAKTIANNISNADSPSVGQALSILTVISEQRTGALFLINHGKHKLCVLDLYDSCSCGSALTAAITI